MTESCVLIVDDEPDMRELLTLTLARMDISVKAAEDLAEARAFYGGTDAPHLGFPTVIFGAGRLQQAHSMNEYVEIDDMMVATQVYLCSVLDLLGCT